MNFIISQFNWWDLARHYNNKEHTFYYRTMPTYLSTWMRERGIRLVKSEVKPEDAILPHGSYSDWPSESELRDDILVRKFYIDNDNYYTVIQSISDSDFLIYSEDLTIPLSEELQKRATFYSKNDNKDVPKERIVLNHIPVQPNSPLNIVPPEYELVHYIGNVVNSVEYRRHKLNKYLRSKYKVATIYRGICSLDNVRALIISDPRWAGPLIEEAVKKDIPIYYDRTDNWNALYPQVEDFVILKARTVFCSSKYLYEHTNHPNKIRLDNAADEWTYTPSEKSRIAVYIGKALNKQNQEYCNKLRLDHPDFKFVSIGAPIEGFEHIAFLPKDVLMSYLEKCTIGLVPIKDEEYYKGQFNLKVWDYINAHLSVLVTNDYNYEHVKNVHTEWNTDFVEEEVPLWSEVFERINKEIK